jgi:hypothetical protein
MDNGGQWSGSIPTVDHAAAVSLKAYDELPREVRDALKDASILIDPVSLLRGLRAGRKAQWAIDAIRSDGHQFYVQDFQRTTGVKPP